MNKQLAFVQACVKAGCTQKDITLITAIYIDNQAETKLSKDLFVKKIESLVNTSLFDSNFIINNLLKLIK